MLFLHHCVRLLTVADDVVRCPSSIGCAINRHVGPKGIDSETEIADR